MQKSKSAIYPVSAELSKVDVQILSPRIFILMVFIIIVFTLLRCVHLGADTPEGISNNVGIYIDEGYKTFGPKNIVLFGNSRWHPADEYSGWVKTSPLTNWLYYISFKLFGLQIQAARIVTIGYFLLFLSGYFIAMGRQYNKALLLSGVAALSIQSTLFFFSRVALLEIPLVAVVYGCLFFLHNLECRQRPVTLNIAVLIGAMTIGFYGIKASALLYFMPICLSFAIVLVLSLYSSKRRRHILYGVLCFLILALILAISTRHIWLYRVAVLSTHVLHRALVSPIVEMSPFTVVLGLLCASQAVLFYPKAIFNSKYHCSLLALIILCPITLSLFPYNPSRYYVPVIPAYILMVLEWFQLKSTQKIEKTTQWLPKVIGFVLFFFCTFSIGVMLNKLIIANLPFNIGDEPGLSPPTMVRYFTPIAAVGAAIIYSFHRKTFSTTVVNVSVLLLVAFAIVYNSFALVKFITHPSYRSRNIQQQIAKIVPRDASIAGDWAPFFTTNTRIRSLYMNNNFNRNNLSIIRPDFFLNSSNQNSYGNIQTIYKSNAVILDPPVYQSEYIGFELKLYKVAYNR